MQLLPHSKEKWLDLTLLPVKVCLVVSVMALVLNLPFSRLVIYDCWLVSVPVLMVGVLLQVIFRRVGEALWTLLILGFCLLLLNWADWAQTIFLTLILAAWLIWRWAQIFERPAATSEEPIECLKCRTIMPSGESKCLHCGWTYKIEDNPRTKNPNADGG
ncbi:MAG: hypothetical protein WCO56_06405 [Verrucomicrobiota bacterium]